MNLHLAKISAVGGALLLVLGCSTPAKRIEERQELFDGYSTSVQENIRAGRVTTRMTEDAVWMALGDPNRKSVESTDAGDVLIWLYTRSQPGFSVGVGGGGGSYGSSRVGGGVGVGRGAERDELALVHFQDGVVIFVRQATE